MAKPKNEDFRIDANKLRKVFEVIAIGFPPPTDLSPSQTAMINGPYTGVADLLKEMFFSRTEISLADATTRSRIFYALMHLKGFDKVGFLIDLYSRSESNWRSACCRELAIQKSKKAIAKLEEIVMNDPDADVRFTVIESLELLANPSSIRSLEYVSQHDTGEDYEGRSLAERARNAISKLQNQEE
jgi:HEAT repeat protein